MRQVGRERRRAYRIPATGLRVRVIGYERDFEAKDVSVSGIGFLQGANPFKLAQVLRLDVLENGRVVVEGLPAIVARMGLGVVGCAFLRLDEAAQENLERLLLRKREELLGAAEA